MRGHWNWDPNFAAAYLAMAAVYIPHQEHERAEEMIRKAYALRDKVSEREPLWIEEQYYEIVPFRRHHIRGVFA